MDFCWPFVDSIVMSMTPSTNPPIRDPFPDQRPVALAPLRNRPLPWLILLIGLLVTLTAAWFMKENVERAAEQKLVTLCNKIQSDIASRLDDHARLLLSGAALFRASEHVTREEWRLFTQYQRLDTQLPGIQGTGFSLLIPPAKLAQHILEIRNQGFPEYQPYPPGERDIYSSIIYLEPFSDRNLRAFGYDMFSEPVRRDAMERARDTNMPALSGKVLLVQETDQEVQAGNLMYVPIYRHDLPIETVEQRRAAIYGWVYSPYRMRDLMHGILGVNFLHDKQLHLEIFDGELVAPEKLLFADSHHGDSSEETAEKSFVRLDTVDFHGHRWTLRFSQQGEDSSSVEYSRVWMILVGGTLISLLLCALIRSLQRTAIEALKSSQELRQSADRLLRSEERLNMALQIGNAGTWGYNIETREAWCSAEGASIFGWPATAVKMPLEDLEALIPEQNQFHEALIALTEEGREYGNLEIAINPADGSQPRVISSTAVLKHSEQGSPREVIGFVQDISARKQDEKLLRQLAEDLQNKNNELERFTATISHDLKSPLVTVQGFVGLLEQGLGEEVEDEVRSSLNYIKTATHKMYSLIDDLLALSRLGKAVALEERVSLQEVAHEALELLRGPVADDSMSIEIAADLPWLIGDRQRLREMMQNLLENAIKYMGEQPAPRIEVGTAFVDGKRACYVRDNGIGIPLQHQEQVFGLFERLNADIEGTGIGLAKVRRIAELHGGRVWIESAGQGKGTTLWFTLPWEEPSHENTGRAD